MTIVGDSRFIFEVWGDSYYRLSIELNDKVHSLLGNHDDVAVKVERFDIREVHRSSGKYKADITVNLNPTS